MRILKLVPILSIRLFGVLVQWTQSARSPTSHVDKREKRGSRMRGFLHAGCLGILLIIGLALTGCGESLQAAVVAPTAIPSPANTLASIQIGSPIAVTDPLVGRFQTQLDALAPRCKENEQKLANELVATRNLMAKRGVVESYLDLLKHVRGSIPAIAPREPCLDIFALYATFRTQPSTAAPLPTVAPTFAAPTPTAALSSDQQAVTDYHTAVRAAYDQHHDYSQLPSTASGSALASVMCIARDKADSLTNTGAYFRHVGLGFSFTQITVSGTSATAVENRHAILTLFKSDGTSSNQEQNYTATYSLTNDGTHWLVTDHTWTAPDGSSGGSQQDASPCSQAATATPNAPSSTNAQPPAVAAPPAPNSASSSGSFTVTASVDPNPMTYNAYPTLSAQTTPGADCTASVVYDTGRAPVSFDGSDQVADSSGQVSWSWHEETIGAGGTANVDCSLNGQSGSDQVSFSVSG